MGKNKNEFRDCEIPSIFDTFIIAPVCVIFQLLFYAIQFVFWYIACLLNLVRRFYSSPFVNNTNVRKYQRNTVFIGGIFSTIPSYTGKIFWTRARDMWSPRIGMISCLKDRACEAIYDILGESEVTYVDKLNHSSSKSFFGNRSFIGNLLESIVKVILQENSCDMPLRPDLRNKLKIVCYSAGASTFNQMLIYIHENNVGYIKQKIANREELTDRQKEIYEKISDPHNERYKPHFPYVKENIQDGKVLKKHLTPDMFEKIVYISPAMTGVEWVSEGLNLNKCGQSYSIYSLVWIVSVLFYIYYAIVGDTEGYLISPYLGQYSNNIFGFINNGRNLVQDMADIETLKSSSIEAMEIIKLYDLETIRVVTSASTKVGCNYYVKPDSDPNNYLYWFLGSRLFKKKHDGIISLDSQLLNVECACLRENCFDTLSKCDKCNTIVCPTDHTSVISDSDRDKDREDAWEYINKFLEECCD